MICVLLIVYSYILFARLLLSWFPAPPDWARPIYGFLYSITDPVLRLARRAGLPTIRIGMTALDLSPILVFIAIQIIVRVLAAQGLC